MLNLKKIITIGIVSTITTISFASTSNVSRMTNSSLLGLSTYSPTSPSMAPLSTGNGNSYYFEAHDVDKKICYDTFFGDCHHQKNILGDVIKVNKNGKVTRELNDWFASGQQPSVAAIGNGFFVVVTTTQDAHALQGYIVQVVESKGHFKIKKLDSVNLGRGLNPSVASMGNGYFMVTSSNDNNITGEHFLAAYVFKATESKIYTPEYMNTYADGALSEISYLGNGQFLETNNTTNGIEYNLLDTKDNQIVAKRLNIVGDDQTLSNQEYTSVKLTPTGQTGNHGNHGNQQYLQVFTLAGQKGMCSKLLEVKGDNVYTTNSYQFASSGEYPVAVPFQANKYLEVDINKIIGSETGLYASILS
jgi:hypothetical protein